MTQSHIRPATHADLASIASFIAALNVLPHHRCLHCDEDVASIRRSMEQLPSPAEQAFVVAEQDGALVGVVGSDTNEEQGRGWLWGPFADTEPWDATVDALLTQLMTQLPAAVRQLDDFLDLDNQRSIAGLARHGFIVRGLTHVYEALRPLTPISIEQRLPLLADADKEAFRELHDALFPATYKNGTQILAERDADHRVFAYHNGELLGYLYAAPSESADAGYIHYVGVREDARNQGIGYRLVTSALHWMFEERGWTKVNLTVADTHEQARALYARSGFRLLYTGVGQRKTW
jgi:GNAT superfamily N-acetyltransferase